MTRCDQPNRSVYHSNFPLPRLVIRHHHFDVTCDIAGSQHSAATPCKRDSLPCNVSRHLTAPAHSMALPTLPNGPSALYIVPMTFPRRWIVGMRANCPDFGFSFTADSFCFSPQQETNTNAQTALAVHSRPCTTAKQAHRIRGLSSLQAILINDLNSTRQKQWSACLTRLHFPGHPLRSNTATPFS